MLYVGIDVSKRKHDVFMTNDRGECADITVANDKAGFAELMAKIRGFVPVPSRERITVGLEATGHYSANVTAFLVSEGLEPVVFNPLHTNLYRKGQSLRKTKTDSVDARFIARMLMTGDHTPHTPTSYHISELKRLTRHRHRLLKSLSTLKISYSRQIDVMFPELPSIVGGIHAKGVLAMLLDLPGVDAIASCHLTHLKKVLESNSHGRFGRDIAIGVRSLAADSIGQSSPALALELTQTIRMMQFQQSELNLLNREIRRLVDDMAPPFMGIKGMGHVLAGAILAEIGDISRFGSASKLQAFAGLDPSTYQSGQFVSARDSMVKRGSAYLRYAIMQAARLVARHDPVFGSVLKRKLAEGKHYNVAVSHVAKKLIRVIFHLMATGKEYVVMA